jgi:hypothetical protein
VAGCLVAAVALGGCQASAWHRTRRQDSTATTGAPVVADERGNGGTVRLEAGGQLEVDLHSLYWTVQGSSDPYVLSQDGPPERVAAGPDACPPGVGCGLQRIVFTARHPGTATIRASRISCGEARGCTSEQGAYQLNVIVGAF